MNIIHISAAFVNKSETIGNVAKLISLQTWNKREQKKEATVIH